MKVKLYLFIIFISFLAILLLQNPARVFAQSPPALIMQRAAGSTTDDQFRSMALTSDGGCIVSGYSTSPNGDVALHLGQGDYWVVKLDTSFAIQWQQTLGGTGKDFARDVSKTSDGGYVVLGYSNSTGGQVTGNHGNFDYWLTKLNSNGALQWQKSMGGSNEDNAYTVRQTPDGGYICSGYSFSNNGDVTGNHGHEDGWVVKLNAAHDIQWQRSFGGTNSDQIDGVILTSDGGYLLVGYTSSVNGDVTSNHGNQDMWVIKINSSGSIQWQKTYGGATNDAGRKGVQTPDGGYIIAGFSASTNGDATENHGKLDYWILKIDGNGNLQWQRSFGGSEDDYAYSIESTFDGNYLVTGSSGSNDGNATGNHGGKDIWLLKIDSFGNLLWQKNLGGSLEEEARACGQKTDGSILVAGFTKSSDGDVSGQHGGYDGWIARVCVTSEFYADIDHDGYGNALVSIIGCSVPSGYVVDQTDCNDNDSTIHPNSTEACNAIDDNCNGQIDDGAPQFSFYADADNDGYGNSDVTTVGCSTPAGYSSDSGDCDDNNTLIHPNASEICNGGDDNCNGVIDEGILQPTFYADADNDGYGNADLTTIACTAPAGYTSDSGDCDDNNAGIHPNAPEIYNGLDDNCNGEIDEENPQLTFYADGDNDGYGNSDSTTSAFTAPAGYVADSSDCDDNNAGIHPNAIEICNGVDDNCNNQADEGTQITYYADADNDGYGNSDVTTMACTAPAGYTADSSDCNDNNASIHPNATEICNAIDDNCNSQTDEGTQITYYADADGDGYGNPQTSIVSCTSVTGFISNNTDCNDSNTSIHPNAPDLCNSIDDNCNGVIDENSISATITPSGTITICSGTSTSLTANSGSGITYQWLKGSAQIAGATNQAYVTSVKGNYQVTESNNFSCSSTSAITKINAVNKPEATVTPLGNLDICQSGSVTLQANAGSALSYQWKKASINVIGATNQTYVASAPATYKVMVTNSSGCTKISSGANVIKSCREANSSAGELKLVELSLYPNPVDAWFMVNLKLNDDVNTEATVQVMNLLGQKVYDQNVPIKDGILQQEIILDNSNPNGIYLVIVMVNNQEYCGRIILLK